MNGDGNEWIFCSIFKIQDAGYLSTSKSREARSTAIPSFLKGHPDEQVSLGKVRWKGVLDQATLRAVRALLMGAVNALGSVCQECWAKEVSFPGVGTSDSAPLTLESLLNTECWALSPDTDPAGLGWGKEQASANLQGRPVPPGEDPVVASHRLPSANCWARLCLRRKPM